MRIYAMKTNHIKSPLGFETSPVTFSWKVEQTSSARAVAARVEVSLGEAFGENDVIHDSGFDASIENTAYMPFAAGVGVTHDGAGKAAEPLRPRTRYWWRVTVRGDKGDEAVSQPEWFETGKMDEPWTAQWITPSFDKTVHPRFRKSFVLKSGVASARVYACGLGVYELLINGKKAGDEYLAPGCHSYNNWLQYQTYDVTSLLKEGENVAGAMLGNGWAKGRFGLSASGEIYCGEFGFIAEIHVLYKNGDSEVINTDAGWSCAPSPVTDSSIYDGETYDGRLEDDWTSGGYTLGGNTTGGNTLGGNAPAGNTPTEHTPVGYAPDKWENAVVSADYTEKWKLGPLHDRLSLPVRAMQELKPVALLRTPAGEDVLDMGQNMVGFLRFFCRADAGTKLSLYFGELLQDGNFYRDNLRSAKAEYHYISGGRPSEVRPLFTFFGFRYVKLEGFGDIDINDFTGLVLYSDMTQTGNIETSDDKVNRLYQNVIWGQRGNFLDVPTDCPQRDERLGWTGDAQIFCETAAWNMDVYAFFAKYLRDLAYDQAECGGAVPNVIPNVFPRKAGGNAGGAACGWADAATVIPWTMYQMYGDKSVLRSAFPSMKAWVDWIKAEDGRSGGRRLWTTGFHFGDWLAMDAPVPGGTFGATDVGFTASAYYYYSAMLVAKAAEALCDAENARFYNELAAEVKTAIRNEYFTPSGRIAVKTQTAMVMALDFGLYPEGHRARLIESLKMRLVQDGMKLKTGFLGTPALCSVLSDNGAHPYALKLFFNEEMPGWLYPVGMGATTIWERWDSVLPDGKISDTGMNSLNHYAYGSVASWMYRYLCGIIPTAPGFSRVRIAPRTEGRLTFVKSSFDSPHGTISSNWNKLEDGLVRLECVIPFGVTGVLSLPCRAVDTIQKVLPSAAVDGVVDGAVFNRTMPAAVAIDGVVDTAADDGAVTDTAGNGVVVDTAVETSAGDGIAVELQAGSYIITYKPETAQKFSLATPVYELLADERTSAIFATIPAFKALPENILVYSLGELMAFIETTFPHLSGTAKGLTAMIIGS